MPKKHSLEVRPILHMLFLNDAEILLWARLDASLWVRPMLFVACVV